MLFVVWIISSINSETLDLSSEESAVSGISLPLREITGDVYLDGGSVYLEVSDGEFKVEVRESVSMKDMVWSVPVEAFSRS